MRIEEVTRRRFEERRVARERYERDQRVRDQRRSDELYLHQSQRGEEGAAHPDCEVEETEAPLPALLADEELHGQVKFKGPEDHVPLAHVHLDLVGTEVYYQDDVARGRRVGSGNQAAPRPPTPPDAPARLSAQTRDVRRPPETNLMWAAPRAELRPQAAPPASSASAPPVSVRKAATSSHVPLPIRQSLPQQQRPSSSSAASPSLPSWPAHVSSSSSLHDPKPKQVPVTRPSFGPSAAAPSQSLVGPDEDTRKVFMGDEVEGTEVDDEVDRDDEESVSIESLRAQNPHLLPHFQSILGFNRFAQHILTVNRLGFCEANARKIMREELTDFQYPRWVDLVELGISMLQRGPGYLDADVSNYAVRLLFFTWSSSTAHGANGTSPDEISETRRNYLREMPSQLHQGYARMVADELERPSRRFSQEQLVEFFDIVTCGLHRLFPNPFKADTLRRPPAPISLTAPLALATPALTSVGAPPPATTSAEERTESSSSTHSRDEAAARARGEVTRQERKLAAEKKKEEKEEKRRQSTSLTLARPSPVKRKAAASSAVGGSEEDGNSSPEGVRRVERWEGREDSEEEEEKETEASGAEGTMVRPGGGGILRRGVEGLAMRAKPGKLRASFASAKKKTKAESGKTEADAAGKKIN